ncbi:MAG: SOS response-associated peptidase [Burkholderiales bacterium]|nr:MAG: SOS response-associated peptidase [Burkholderiales bacterium]
MCGRYVLYGPGEALIEGFSLIDLTPFVPRYNIAPASAVLVVRDEPGRGRVAEQMRWGLIPHWAREPSIGTRLINARGETVADKPAFRQALRRSRCLIPANGFYEWQAPAAGAATRKQPFYIHASDNGLLAMAGLYDRWEGPGGAIATCCIVTTAANATMAPIHDRMPVLVDGAAQSAWLDARVSDVAALAPLLRPCPESWLATHPVAPAVGDARREGPALIEPLGTTHGPPGRH